MQLGPFYNFNQIRLSELTERDWIIALAKCKEHIKLRLKQKTLSGAHSSTNLGADSTDYYLGVAYEKIVYGEWEWKQKFSLIEQMVRIIDSYISKEVARVVTGQAHVSTLSYIDDLTPFYEQVDEFRDENEEVMFEARMRAVEDAIQGDSQLELIIDALKEGMKRADIAELLDLEPRQFDKLREKLIKKVKERQPSMM